MRLDPLRLLLAALTIGLSLLLAAFFGFVGYMKAFAPVATLEQHHAWTTALPLWLGRTVGVSELLLAAALVLALVWRSKAGWIAWAAAALILNQAVAAVVHGSRGETGALPQNIVLVALLIALAAVSRAWLTRATSAVRKPPPSRRASG